MASVFPMWFSWNGGTPRQSFQRLVDYFCPTLGYIITYSYLSLLLLLYRIVRYECVGLWNGTS